MQTDHVILVRTSDLMLINKKTDKQKQTCHLENHTVKMKESKKMEKYLDLAKELQKILEYDGDSDNNCRRCIWNGH